MSIVGRGLGLPEDGALVAGGLGAVGATLTLHGSTSATSIATGDLDAANTPSPPVPVSGGPIAGPIVPRRVRTLAATERSVSSTHGTLGRVVGLAAVDVAAGASRGRVAALVGLTGVEQVEAVAVGVQVRIDDGEVLLLLGLSDRGPVQLSYA